MMAVGCTSSSVMDKEECAVLGPVLNNSSMFIFGQNVDCILIIVLVSYSTVLQ